MIFLFFGVIFVFPEIFAAKPSNNLLASVLLDASVQAAKRSQKQSQRSKMYVTAVQIAEFLIMVIIIMSLPKLVTS